MKLHLPLILVLPALLCIPIFPFSGMSRLPGNPVVDTRLRAICCITAPFPAATIQLRHRKYHNLHRVEPCPGPLPCSQGLRHRGRVERYSNESRIHPGTGHHPPIITAVGSADLTASSATISWTTDEASNHRLNTASSTDYGQSTLSKRHGHLAHQNLPDWPTQLPITTG